MSETSDASRDHAERRGFGGRSAPEGMIRRRVRSALRVIGYALGALVIVFAIALLVLRLTNPRPHQAGHWIAGAAMPHARGEAASAVVGTKMVVAGGLYGVGRTSNAVDDYDLDRDEWTKSRSLPAPRHHAAAAGLGDYVYVSGGARTATNWTPTKTLWRAEPGLEWTALAAMPEGRQGHAMVALRDKLYVVGGVGPTDRTLIYDSGRNTWSTAAPLPLGRDHLRAVAWRGEIWAIGGRTGRPSTHVDIYDPRADGWRRGPSLPEATSAMAVGVLPDGVHVVGGEDPRPFGGRVIRAHFVLGPHSRRWTRAPEAMLAVHGAAYAVHSGRLIVAGGAARPGLLSTISWTPVTQAFRPEGFLVKLYSN